jgi:DNA-binding NarL/FixJ family response regulator
MIAPSPVCRALHYWLNAAEQISPVQWAEDEVQALQLMARCPRALVLMDGGIDTANPCDFPKRVKAGWPQARLIVLTDDPASTQVLESEIGVDLVLPTGTLPARLLEVIRSVLSGQTDTQRVLSGLRERKLS